MLVPRSHFCTKSFLVKPGGGEASRESVLPTSLLALTNDDHTIADYKAHGGPQTDNACCVCTVGVVYVGSILCVCCMVQTDKCHMKEDARYCDLSHEERGEEAGREVPKASTLSRISIVELHPSSPPPFCSPSLPPFSPLLLWTSKLAKSSDGLLLDIVICHIIPLYLFETECLPLVSPSLPPPLSLFIPLPPLPSALLPSLPPPLPYLPQ